MGLLGAFLNKKANQYNIDNTTNTSPSTGQPIESLVFVKRIPVYFGPNPPRVFRLYAVGQVKEGSFVAFSEKATATNQVLEIDDIKYRIVAANPLQFKNRTLAYVNYLEYYKH